MGIFDELDNAEDQITGYGGHLRRSGIRSLSAVTSAKISANPAKAADYLSQFRTKTFFQRKSPSVVRQLGILAGDVASAKQRRFQNVADILKTRGMP